MNIDIWSDFVCPFCYIGEQHLAAAMEKVPFKDELTIQFKSFELDPHQKEFDGTSIDVAIASKYGISVAQARQNNQGIEAQGRSLGLPFDFDQMKPTNTLLAHRLVKYSRTQEKEEAMANRLFQAYFTEGALISNSEELIALAVEVGLDEEEVRQVLKEEQAFLSEVREDERQAQQFGISSVPYIVIDHKYAVKGAQPVTTFVGALETAWQARTAENHGDNVKTENQGLSCDTSGC